MIIASIIGILSIIVPMILGFKVASFGYFVIGGSILLSYTIGLAQQYQRMKDAYSTTKERA